MMDPGCATTTAIVRPKAPRARNALSSSTRASSKTGDDNSTFTYDKVVESASCASSVPSDAPRSSVGHRHFTVINTLETLTPPATPLMSVSSQQGSESASQDVFGPSALSQGESFSSFSNPDFGPVSREITHFENSAKTTEELAILLAEAHRTIRERERELGIAASIGKSLLDSNVALRARQQALFERAQKPLTSPQRPCSLSSVTGSPTSDKAKGRAVDRPSLLPFAALDGQVQYGALGEYIEGRPPPSPYRARSRTASHGSSAGPSPSRHARMISEGSVVSRHGTSPRTSPSRKHHARKTSGKEAACYRRDSEASTSRHRASISTSTALSRSSSVRSMEHFLLTTQAQQQQVQLELEQLHLREENADLEYKLQDLEHELNRADITGKKRLRKLDKELLGLRRELECALERNQELEERLSSRTTPKSSIESDAGNSLRSKPEAATAHDQYSLQDSTDQPHTSLTTASHVPTDTDKQDEACGEQTDIDLADFEARVPALASLPAEKRAAPSSLVAQLLAKVAELEVTNLAMSSQRVTLQTKVDHASMQFEDMKRKYEFLEERVIEAEIRNHRILELEYGGDEEGNAEGEFKPLALTWPQSNTLDQPPTQDDSTSPATKLKRKALGNRPRIENHRRLSSLYGSQSTRRGSNENDFVSPPRKGTLCPDNTRSYTPRSWLTPDHGSARREASPASRLSVSPARSSASTRSRSRASSFFESGEPEEDILTAMRRRLRAEKSALEAHLTAHEHQAATRDPEDYLGSGEDPMGTPHQSLASELGGEWPTEPSVESANPPFATTMVVRSQALAPCASPAAVAASDSESEEEDLGFYLPPGPPDGQQYSELEAVLQDFAIKWEDDSPKNVLALQGHVAGRPQPSQRRGGHAWTYEDGEEENSDNDPWTEEGKPQALESREAIEAKQRLEVRVATRRERLQELARQLAEDEVEDLEERELQHRLEHASIATAVQIVARSDRSPTSASQRRRSSPSSQEDAGDFELVKTDKRPGGRGTDYWPVSYRARYAPQAIVMRVQKKSQDYLNMCLLWTKFLAVLAVAVVFSVWRGPEAGLGVRGRRRNRRVEASIQNAGGDRQALVLKEGIEGDL